MKFFMLILMLLLAFILNACGRPTVEDYNPYFSAKLHVQKPAVAVLSGSVCSFSFLDPTVQDGVELSFCNSPAQITYVAFPTPIGPVQVPFVYTYSATTNVGVLTIDANWDMGLIADVIIKGVK